LRSFSALIVHVYLKTASSQPYPPSKNIREVGISYVHSIITAGNLKIVAAPVVLLQFGNDRKLSATSVKGLFKELSKKGSFTFCCDRFPFF